MAMYDLSGSGTQFVLTASNTFPKGFSISAFGKDNDPFDQESVDIADAEKDLNGNMYTWVLQNPLGLTLSVAANTEEALNLGMIFNRNRAGANRAKDVITLVKILPNGATQSYTSGVMTNGTPGDSVTSDGKMKPKSYGFKFSDYVETPPLS